MKMNRLTSTLNSAKLRISSYYHTITNKSGVALLITLAVITIMVTAGMQIHKQMHLAATSAASSRDQLIAYEMAVSGVNVAKAMLIADREENETDSLQEDWADPEKIKENIKEIPFENGKVKVKITDELSKIQVNALVKFPEGREFNPPQKKIWERFANRLLSLYEDLEDTDPLTIVYSLKDWMDSGDDDAITGLSGAESGYYEDLDPPYACKNGPFTHLGEVALVKGVTPEIFYGLGEIMGLSNYITVHGISEPEGSKDKDEKKQKSGDFTYPGKININTAELPVLTILIPSESEDLAPALIDYREAKADDKYINDLTSEDWYKQVPGFSSIDELPQELISISSDVFRIESTSTLDDVKMTVDTVIQRVHDKKSNKWECKILNWQVE